jgi:hypothetical protein
VSKYTGRTNFIFTYVGNKHVKKWALSKYKKEATAINPKENNLEIPNNIYGNAADNMYKKDDKKFQDIFTLYGQYCQR